MKKKSLRDISRFSAKAACRYRLIWIAMVFIVVVILAVGSALILAFDELAPPPTYGFEFSLSGGRPGLLNPFSGAGDKESGVAAHFLCLSNEARQRRRTSTF